MIHFNERSHTNSRHGKLVPKNWRYIQYADGSQELYNMQSDPNEWSNLASQPEYATVIAEHQKWIPDSVQPAPGSKHRILLHRADGTVNWEGQDVAADDPIPEID